MHNLVSRAPHSIVAHLGDDGYRKYAGLLTSPRTGFNPGTAIAYGAKWAADNDAYAFWKRGETYNPRPLLLALERWKPYCEHCLFVNAPDVLTNARATLEMFWWWQPIIRAHGYPVAFTVQDGVQDTGIPAWQHFDALFIGATNTTKYSQCVFDLVSEANRRGVWVHNGRVNTPAFVRATKAMGCNSFDGTGFTIETQKVKTALPYQIHTQQTIWELIS